MITDVKMCGKMFRICPEVPLPVEYEMVCNHSVVEKPLLRYHQVLFTYRLTVQEL